jgi:hypothetical protein
MTRVSNEFGFLFLVTVPVAIWLVVKFTLTESLYIIENGRTTVFGSFSLTWQSVETDRWWRVLGLTLCIGLTVAFPGAILRSLLQPFFSTLASSEFIGAWAGALAFSALTVMGIVWTQLSLVGMASRMLPAELTE